MLDWSTLAARRRIGRQGGRAATGANWIGKAACIGFVSLLVAPAPGIAKSLADAVQFALSVHPEIQRDQALRRAADKFVDERFSGYLPTLDIDAATGYEYSNNPTTRSAAGSGLTKDLWRNEATVSARQMVFDGFQTSSQLRSARADRDAAGERIVETNERIGFRSVRVYLEVLRNQEVVGLAEANLAAHQDIVRRVRKQVDAGIADSVDLDQGAARLALAQAELSQRMGGLRRAIVRYTEVVGEPPKGLVRPPRPDYDQPVDVDAAIDRALNDNPTVAVTAARSQARTADIGVARAPYFPRLDVELTGTTIDNLDGVNGRNTTFSALLRMRYNLFRGFFDRASKRRATFEAAAAADDDSEARRSVRENVRVAYRALTTAQARLQPLGDNAAAAERTLQAYYGQYDLGRRSLFDLLDTQSELFRARVGLVDGEYAVLTGHFRLLFTMGRLLAGLAIDAPRGSG